MHFQRANVALSRARDKMILVRSLEISDVPNEDDVKIPIMEFFSKGQDYEAETAIEPSDRLRVSWQAEGVTSLLVKLLTDVGYSVRSMGVVWKGGLCVESTGSDTRAAVMLDCGNGSAQDWQESYTQQKAIERVGWKCLRVDVLSFLTETKEAMKTITRFLEVVAGVILPPKEDEETLGDYSPADENELVDLADEGQSDPVNVAQVDIGNALNNNMHELEVPIANANGIAAHEMAELDSSIVVISSEDEDTKKRAAVPESVPSYSLGYLEEDRMDPSNFGVVVDLGFLKTEDDESISRGDGTRPFATMPQYGGDNEYQADQESHATDVSTKHKRRKLSSKGDRNSRWSRRDDSDHDEMSWKDSDVESSTQETPK